MDRVRVVDAVFDGEPGVNGSKFVEVEDSEGHMLGFGEWVLREDGRWQLHIPIEVPEMEQPNDIGRQ